MTSAQEILSLSAMLGSKIPIEFFNRKFDNDEHIFCALSYKNLTFKNWVLTIDAHKQILIDQDIHWTCPFDQNYPLEFYLLEHPPQFWIYWGKPIWMTKRLLAVVGSREPSEDSADFLRVHLSDFCLDPKFAILSGGARGIDQQAHLIAAKANCPTLAVLPSGLLNMYPKDFLKYKDLILSTGGGFASQYNVFTPMHKGHFFARNRLIASLANGVFVVEANQRSGSRMTAEWALELDRRVATLPVSPMATKGRGALDLIHLGAYPLRDSLDLKLWTSLLPMPQCLEKESSHSKSQELAE